MGKSKIITSIWNQFEQTYQLFVNQVCVECKLWIYATLTPVLQELLIPDLAQIVVDYSLVVKRDVDHFCGASYISPFIAAAAGQTTASELR